MSDSSTLDTAPKDPWVGRTLGDEFRIDRALGSGGFGSVYIAEQLGVQRDVVVKVIRRALTENPSVVSRFQREARVVARLNHPNIVQVYTAGETGDGAHYLVMELVRGETLGDLLQREGKLEELRAVRIGEQIAGALAAAHEAGIVHRDLKPANVMITPVAGNREFVKVLDFGIAKLLGTPESGGETSGLTENGAIVGTPAYMSPEQVSGHTIDGRSDVYTLGLMLYELVTGSHPFEAKTPVQFIIQHLQEPVTPPSVRAPGLRLSADFEAALVRCLAKTPEERFASAEALHAALKRIGDALEASERTLERGPAPAQPRTATQPAPQAKDTADAFAEPPPQRSGAYLAGAVVVGLTFIISGVGIALAFGLGLFDSPPAEESEGDEPPAEVATAETPADDDDAKPNASAAANRVADARANPTRPNVRPTAVPPSRPPTPRPQIPVAEPDKPTSRAEPTPPPAPVALTVSTEGPHGALLPSGSTLSMRSSGMVTYNVPHPIADIAPLFQRHYQSGSGHVMFNMDDVRDPEEPFFSLILTDVDDEGVHMISAHGEGPGRSRIAYFVR